ncbi:hypothetical protein [Pseudoalteromonas tunicata]|jgi:hypothetical protein|uniref:Putative orphan protein n=1 Tax=Pseudoalteromonas tunicata D2 TaxID=87626 RepID=A4CAI7_9GAMM|nr:hypothetical protein [Pseudoalteromonas tunicata]ATC94941.1 hypothetical protein PTUN_a2467 [Pseudoalteromonas tunicata]EAR28395.1 putative orphan protein [Pseudoalteromonas tunicata D2]
MSPLAGRTYRQKPKRKTSLHQLEFIRLVIAELKRSPDKISIIKQNCDYYRQQTFLKKGFLLAIERFDWVFEVDDDIERICQQIQADDFIGNRLRRYPLLFKGIIT